MDVEHGRLNVNIGSQDLDLSGKVVVVVSNDLVNIRLGWSLNMDAANAGLKSPMHDRLAATGG